MTPLAEILRDEIARSGPIPFRRYMEYALYHPEHGYYRRGNDPFGKKGDYYTAEQVQPVFGILIATLMRGFFEEMGRPEDFAVVELGAGRAEMAEAFSEFHYVPVDIGDAMPDRFSGVVFANEFFDALPVELVVVRQGALRMVRVGWEQDRFVWVDAEPAEAAIVDYIACYLPSWEEGNLLEVNLEALAWVERIAGALERGYALSIDYGYTSRERIRFPQGSLMSYHKHAAYDDVLLDPGERDITAHVCFSALAKHGAAQGLESVRFETLAQCLLKAGEADSFGAALAAGTPREEIERRLQLKTLLFGMGETFRTLLQKKDGRR